MGTVRPTDDVLHLAAAFSAYPDALDWARGWCQQAWGPIVLESPPFHFVETDYYTSTMGKNLTKRFFAFQTLASPAELPARKRQANEAEEQLARSGSYPCARPLNLDPGYLTESKLVLASTKDHAHRLHLGDGIYGEITLRYRRGGWEPWEWTYPDYRRADYHAFFDACRSWLRQQG
jgi:hypothetical protein